MIIPNLLLLGFAMFIYHDIFLAGQVTIIGLLLITSSLLPLILRMAKKRWIVLKIMAVGLNVSLFAISGYIFCGTSYLMFKHNMANTTSYILLLTVWLLAVATIKTKNKILYLVFAISLTMCSVTGLYLSLSNQWHYTFNVSVFGLIMLIGLLNVYFLFIKIRSPFKQQLKEPGEA